MRAYVATTGTAFVLVLLAHVARIVSEGWHLATAPAFLASSLLYAGLCGWAFWIWKSLQPKAPAPAT